MTNLIPLRPEQNPEVITLTAYTRSDERVVYVNDKTSTVYYTQTSFAQAVDTLRQTLAHRLSDAKNYGIFEPLEGRVGSGSTIAACKCYSVFQFTEYCKMYNPELVFGGEAFYVNARELHEIGYIQNVIKPADQVIISQAEADIESIKRLMGGVINTALSLPGYNDLGNSIGWVEPKFNGKELQTRQWVEIHFPDLPQYNKIDMKRIGLEFSGNIRHNHLSLPTNSWKTPRNRYREEHHQVLCATFYNTRRLGLIA